MSFSLLSCSLENKQEFSIKNKTSDRIDSIYISTSDYTLISEIIQLNPNSIQSITVNLTNAEPVDGHYILNYKQKDEKHVYSFGYYTNRTSLSGKSYKLSIIQDSIIHSR